MRITYNRLKRERTLAERGLDFRRAKEVFDGPHLTREDDRTDYGELRYITVGWLDARLVVLAWTPRGRARRMISMRKANEREVKKFASQVA
ncbi:MAG TPA: BrnT family toxin [Candidatus Paceibacterota bacterium]|nr:BrnT family toxin [Candidatus Paceibacterota bacterium]